MPKQGRPRHSDPPVEWKVSLPASLAHRITLILADPLSGSTRYGSRSKLIELLLRNWLTSLSPPAKTEGQPAQAVEVARAESAEGGGADHTYATARSEE